MKFSDLKFEPHYAAAGSIQAKHKLKNGITFSCIQGPFFYGGLVGKYEIALMNDEGILIDNIFDSGDQVIGYLTEEEVECYLNKANLYEFI